MDAKTSALEQHNVRARDISTEARDRQKAYLTELVQRYKITPTDIARRSGLTPSTLTRFLNDPDNTSVLSGTTMAKIEREFDPGRDTNAESKVGYAEHDGTEPLSQSQSVWTVKTNDFAGIGLLRGDHLLIDAAEQPAKGDTVVMRIEENGRPIEAVRIFHPPFLFNPAIGSAEPEYLDNKRVKIAGVVRKSWRRYRQLSRL